MQPQAAQPTKKFRTRTPPTPDQQTVMNESAHIPDRDQIFGADHKQFPPPNPEIVGWEGDNEERMVGDRDHKGDLVDAYEAVGEITEPYHDPQTRNSTPTTARPARDATQDLSFLDDEELELRAAALSIAGRTEMNREELIYAIHEASSES